ncbi:fibronectin type III domain-containing protein 1 [Ahaetulla prasina]|uniref:fibronectin type III domain-containing protein 1 n=1 Tax=Ahaetulla prasina TaxID=499056 RepID=UPI0026472531|nr:fibronectin type III domain-containing protein 1 [Ahaetulla prasina]
MAASASRTFWITVGTLLVLLVALLHSASPEKKVPNRPLRTRFRSSSARSSIQWRPSHSANSSPRRYPGYRHGYGESNRKLSFKSLPKEERAHYAKKIASESVYLVSPHSRNFQGRTQPVHQVVLTKRKVPEEDELEETKDIAVRVMSSHSVLVTWTDPSSEKQKRPISSRQYTVRYREKGESARWDYKQVSNKRVLVDKLIPDTMYEFAVKISQGEKEGKWSVSVYQRTPETAPASAPENLNVWSIKGKTPTVVATWDALAESEGKVKEYILSYAPALKPFGAKSISYPGDTTSASVEGLLPGERYIFKIRAGNRRGQGPQSKAFSVALPATNTDELKTNQQTNIEEDPVSDPKNIVLEGSKKEAELKMASHSIEDMVDSVKVTSTMQPKVQDVKESAKSHSVIKPAHTFTSSDKALHRTRTLVRIRQTNTDKPRSLPSSSVPKHTEDETKNLGQDRPNLSPVPKATLDNLPVDNKSKNQLDNLEDKPTVFPRIPEESHSVLLSNKQLSASQKTTHNRPTKLRVPSISIKSPSPTAAAKSQNHSHHFSYKLITPDTSDSPDSDKSRGTEKREQKLNSRASSPPGGSSPSVQTKPLTYSNRHALRDPRITTSAVSAAATHTLPHSRVLSSDKHKSKGRDDSDDSENEKSEREGDEEDRQGSSYSRPNFRPSSGLATSERFDLLKYRSVITSNRFANRATNNNDARMQAPKDPSATQSSKVHPQFSSRLASGSTSLRSNFNINKKQGNKNENPLPSTPLRSYSPPVSKQSSSVDDFKRGSVAETKSHHRVTPTNKPNLVSTQENNHNEEKGTTDADSSRISAEKSFPLHSPTSRSQLDDLKIKTTSPRTKQTPSLSKKPNTALSRKMAESIRSSKAVTDWAQVRSSLNSRSDLISLSKNDKELTDNDSSEDEETNVKEEQRGSPLIPAKEVPISRRIPTSFSQGRTRSLSKHFNSRFDRTDERSQTQLLPEKQAGSRVITSTEVTSDMYKLPSSSQRSKYVQPISTSSKDTIRDNQYSRETSLKQTRLSEPHYPSGSRISSRIASQINKKHGLFQPTPTKAELSPKLPSSKIHQSVSNNDGDYEDYDQSDVDKDPILSSSAKTSQISNKLKSLPKLNLTLPHISESVSSHSRLTSSVSPTHSSTSPSVPPVQRIQNSRLLNPSQRHQFRFPHRQGNGGRPNLKTKTDPNNKIIPNNNGKRNGQKIISGPQGVKWIVDLDRGLVLNAEGRYLQDSQGKPLRVKLGGDGRTIVDSKGAPVISPDGLPLFGHGRFSKPVANAQDKPIISLGGKPLIGLEMVKRTTTPYTTTTTTTPEPTTTPKPTTTPEPTTTITTTTPEPTTTVPPTEKPRPTCPPGTHTENDEQGNFVLDSDGLPECYSEDVFSGFDADITGTTESYVVYDEDYELFETTLPPSTTATTTTTITTTEALPENNFSEFSVTGTDPLSEYDSAGKKRFTAPYVTYLNKDPAAPCSLTEALDHFQVESLDELVPKNLNTGMQPQKTPHNITIVAVEGCHSFVIVDWAAPTHGDLVTGYLVYSASYEDVIRNKWSAKSAVNSNLPIENLKPNTRYYFKVQATNPYGYGPISSSITYITESDNPLLIVRPPGGEPIWIPFNFKYDPTYSECSGKQYVKRTWYRKFVGVVLCNSLRYKIYLSDDLRDTFYSIGDSWGRCEDHCQFVDSHLDGRTGPQSYVNALPPIQGYYRQYRQEPVSFGRIGYMTPYYYVGWYECGVTIPGKW